MEAEPVVGVESPTRAKIVKEVVEPHATKVTEPAHSGGGAAQSTGLDALIEGIGEGPS